MGESAESLMRRGAISARQSAKLGILKKTKVERADEEEFHGKQGLRDQGSRKDHGHEVAKHDHVNRHQEVAKRREMGLDGPSKAIPGRDSGGGVRNGRGGAVVAGPDEIGQSGTQKPYFPKSAGTTQASRGGREDTGGYSGDRMPNKSGSLKIDRRVKPAKGVSNKRAGFKVAKQGGMYGGGGRDTQ